MKFTSYEAWQEFEDERRALPATLAEIDQYEAGMKGYERPNQAWILSDFDVWYPNPSYRGPRMPHPDDNFDDDYLLTTQVETTDVDDDLIFVDDDLPF